MLGFVVLWFCGVVDWFLVFEVLVVFYLVWYWFGFPVAAVSCWLPRCGLGWRLSGLVWVICFAGLVLIDDVVGCLFGCYAIASGDWFDFV